jgi:hypothetical protein
MQSPVYSQITHRRIMQPTQDALTEYAAVVAGIQSANIEITPEMQQRADQIRGVVAETQRLATIDQGVARSQDLAVSKDWGGPTA